MGLEVTDDVTEEDSVKDRCDCSLDPITSVGGNDEVAWRLSSEG